METPYGDIPDRLARDMTPRDMHDFLARRVRRRSVLRGGGVIVAASVAPMFWRQSAALAGTTKPGPQWIGFGADPTTQMYLSWSTGSASSRAGAPPSPRVRWGLDATYGSVAAADNVAQVPVPAVTGEPPERTFYNSMLLSGLAPATTYHYAVSNDGVTWSADTTFSTAAAGLPAFRFTAFGDEAASALTAMPMAQLVASLQPAFHVITGDLSYASPGRVLPEVAGFHPAQWDKYLAAVGPAAAQSIPWQPSVGAHEIEPLADNGYAGFVTRFPLPYDLSSGSPVVHDFSYGNVAVIQLDGNDVSAQETLNTGYTYGAQTAWLASTLASYRSTPGIDFIVVVCNCCCYSSNRSHGSDGGLRDVWGPLFDTYQVDLVLSGHVHAYERSNPILAGQVTAVVPPGGTVSPVSDGTTYICAGGGGNGLYRNWYGPTGAGDPGSSAAPKIWRWSGGDTALGGTGKPENLTDSVQGYSACRRAVWHCVCVDVAPPADPGGPTSMLVSTLMPTQTTTAVTSISSPVVIDSVTVIRASSVG